jgi:nucleoside-diphosphate kinase
MDRLLREERERTLSGQSSTKTFAFLKPEALQSRVAGEILSRLERKGFNIKQLRLHHVSRKEAETLYAVHKAKPFFQELVGHVTSGPVVLMILEGSNAVDVLRKVIGATNPQTAEPGTIRGDLSLSITANMIHASDSLENAKKESAIFFHDGI